MEGNRIKTARIAKGLTQEELGKLVGVSGVAIMRYEKNQRQPKQKLVYKLSKVLDVNEAWLMGYDVSMERTDNNIDDFLKVITKKFECFLKYLESIDYKIKIEKDIDEEIEKETYTVTMIKDKDKITFTEKEFEEFQSTIKNSVDYQVWLKNSKQSK